MSKYIDADEFVKDLECLCDIVCQYSKKQRDVMCGACPLGDAFELLDNQPAADVQEVRLGRWEHYEHREPQYDIMGIKTWAEAYKCSNCGFIHSVIEDFGHYAYCPNCGTRMDEVEE